MSGGIVYSAIYSSFTIFAEWFFFQISSQRDVIASWGLYPDLTISIWLHAAKLHNSVLSTFRAICRNQFRKISEPTVGIN